MHINKFRTFKDVDISIGQKLTLISGKNGTGKSTILGILAQVCSFTTNYIPANNEEGFSKEELYNLKTIYEENFQSDFTDHFKISKDYDLPSVNEYSVDFTLDDAEEQLNLLATLKGTSRKGKLRLVLRKDQELTGNTSRNITFPTIYLSLRRLTPFAARKTSLKKVVLAEDEKKDFINISNRLFTPVTNHNHIDSNFDKQSVNSTVNTSDDYDITSASTGEDNLGQIITAMLSFKRLKKNWKNYKGGLLLIDEIDASLFPHVQSKLVEELNKFASKNDVQVVFTTHSPTMISKVLELDGKAKKSTSTKNNIGLNFLSNNFGPITNNIDFTFEEIIANLNVSAPKTQSHNKKINVYCEDSEAYAFIKAILPTNLKSKSKFMQNVKIGSESLISLRKNNILEFTKQSIIVLDGDKGKKANKNLCYLPSSTPPDQLMFYLLYNLDPNDEYWHKDPSWDKVIFLNQRSALEIQENLEFDDKKCNYDFKDESHLRKQKKVREFFKDWFNKNKKILTKLDTNPIKQLWIKEHAKDVEDFSVTYEKMLNYVSARTNYLS